jgi:cbb3-type cytochrome oxidase maturation protein
VVALSLTGLLAGLALGVLALAGFAWAWRRGQFDRLDEQAHLVFESRD